MKAKKIILIISMFSLVAGALSACGSSKEAGTQTSETVPSANRTEESTSMAEDTSKENASANVKTGTDDKSQNTEILEGDISNKNDSDSSEVTEPSIQLEKDYSIQIPVYVRTYSELDTSFKRFYRNFQINDEGRILSYEMSENEKSWSGYINEYDENGWLIKTIYDNNRYGTTTEYEYNENGQRIKSTTVDNDNPSESKEIEYRYDDNGILAEIIYIDSGNIVNTQYELDDFDRIIKITRPTGAEETFEYDDSNHIIKETQTRYNDNRDIKTIYEETIEYDLYGHFVHGDVVQTYDIDGKELSESKKDFIYDIGGYKTLNASDNNFLVTTDQWAFFDEAKDIPKPDTVFLNMCKLESSEEGNYKYSLKADEYDPGICDYVTYVFTEVTSDTAQDTPNEILWSYEAVLTQLLEYEIVEQEEVGLFNINKNGKTVGNLQFVNSEGDYYIIISFNP